MSDDNITKLNGGKTPKSIIKKLEDRIEEARLKTFETNAEAILKVLNEARRTVKLQEAKLEQLISDFNEGL